MPLRGHRRPHFARRAVLPRVAEERGARRHVHHQQPVLVERRRQVLQLRAGAPSSASRSRRRCSCRTRTSARHDRASRCATSSTRSTGRRVRATSASRRSSSRSTAAAGGTSTRCDSPEEFFAAYDQTRHALHDAAGRRQLQGVRPLLRVGQEDVRIMPYDPRRAVPRALRQEPAAVRSRRCSPASSAMRTRSARRSATT